MLDGITLHAMFNIAQGTAEWASPQVYSHMHLFMIGSHEHLAAEIALVTSHSTPIYRSRQTGIYIRLLCITNQTQLVGVNVVAQSVTD